MCALSLTFGTNTPTVQGEVQAYVTSSRNGSRGRFFRKRTGLQLQGPSFAMPLTTFVLNKHAKFMPNLCILNLLISFLKVVSPDLKKKKVQAPHDVEPPGLTTRRTLVGRLGQTQIRTA